MYTTCLFCHAPLGANEVIEHFPVGRRLAFDAAKGRLWVVCRRCERWNLTPLEERWEAIEEAERRYRATRLRAATDNVGLAKLSEGLELVRVGKPLRPEFAAWRYGDQFGRRRTRAVVAGALGAGAAGVGLAVGAAAGAGVLALLPLFQLGTVLSVVGSTRLHAPLRLPEPDGSALVINPNNRTSARLVQMPGDEGWGIDIAYAGRSIPGIPDWKQSWAWNNSAESGRVRLTGERALWAAGRILPISNRGGAPANRVRSAVGLIEDAGTGDAFYRWAATRLREWSAQQTQGDTGALDHLPVPVRLAMEMAAHEDVERQALEGELSLLEEAWKDAEEIAAIADDLLLPSDVRSRLARLLSGRRSPPAEREPPPR